MLNHVVLIKFKKDVTEERIKELENLLEELPNKIIEIHSFEFGRDIIHSDRSYDFALISLFANIESLQRYQIHPDHQIVLKNIQSICESISTVDFMGTDASDFKEKTPEQGIGTW
ncbi:MAG TPA: Dabb family protein [Desulfobacteraceae bacterium]|nr:Dabb family protein [Desulfobacteraceae bacterium]